MSDNKYITTLNENIIEITMKYACMVMNKVINPPEDSMDAKSTIVHLAKEFEENFPPEYWDGEPLDYLEEIEKFAEKRLLEEFG